MRIDVIVDTICPWCFIGLKRLERALAARPNYRFELGFRPFQLNPSMPSAGRERREFLREHFGSRHRLASQTEAVVRAGKAENIAFRFDRIRRTPNTIDSHRLILAAGNAGNQLPLVRALFEAYFLHGRDLGDRFALIDIAMSAGLTQEIAWTALENRAYLDQVVAEDELARGLGVNGVPCFVVERRYAVSGAQPSEVFLQIFDLAHLDTFDVAAE